MQALDRQRERQELLGRISELKLRYNALAESAVLPDELLVEIFKIYALLEIGDRRFCYSWFKITHVCRHWRDVALQAPVLWSTISFAGNTKHPGRALEQLARSGTAPLHLHIFFPKPLCSASTNLTLSIPRARSVYFECEETVAGLSDAAPSDAPSLSSVKMEGDFAVQLLRHCRMPRLQDAHLKAQTFSWHHGVVQPSITKLSVRVESTFIEPVSTFIQVLQGMPLLEELKVRGRFPRRVDSAVVPSQSVSLPHLAELELLVGWEDWCFLDSNLDIPVTTRQHVDLSSFELEQPEDATPIFSKLVSKLRNLTVHSHIYIQSVTYEENLGDHQLELFTRSTSAKALARGRADAFFTISMQSCPFSDTVLLPLFHLLPLAHVTAVCISGIKCFFGDPQDTALRQALISAMRDAAQNISTLCLVGEYPTDLASFLVLETTVDPLQALQSGMQAEQWIMPKLQTLYLEDARFRPYGKRGKEQPSQFRTDLTEALFNRIAAGRSVRHLILSECVGIWEEDVQIFRNILKMGCEDWKLEWDGNELEWAEDDWVYEMDDRAMEE
ncbi:hypothetical protein EIP91_005520 [Steccherinum ochraceum]|uniref:F-box domain-containing protein n=1 Tax=Steccherinum ochraceum TaxID=92696 RepID=A0A4R0S470_9APHY|nr:hypothetical protein EIP91_005520 [Steccherinum ochraceum]